MPIAWDIQTFDRLNSTQSFIKTYSDLYEGFGVRCARQDNGVGRHGRVWEFGEGNLFFSFCITPYCAPQNVWHLSLLTGLAVFQCVHHFIPVAKLKWPNDILIGNKKCAGILIDVDDVQNNIIQKAVIGIGINVAHSPLETSTSLSDHSTRDISEDDVFQVLLNRFSKNYDEWRKNGINNIHDEYCSCHLSCGTAMCVKIDERVVEGQFKAIDRSGNLILIDDRTGQDIMVSSGDVFLADCSL